MTKCKSKIFLNFSFANFQHIYLWSELSSSTIGPSYCPCFLQPPKKGVLKPRIGPFYLVTQITLHGSKLTKSAIDLAHYQRTYSIVIFHLSFNFHSSLFHAMLHIWRYLKSLGWKFTNSLLWICNIIFSFKFWSHITNLLQQVLNRCKQFFSCLTLNFGDTIHAA